MKAEPNRSRYPRWTSGVRGWLREQFPSHAHIYFGVSGTTLLYDVFRNQPRTTVVLPAFVCPTISAAAALAGKRVVHIDANKHTQLPEVADVATCLAGLDESDTVLLVDHSFGFPFTGLPALRRKFPRLLIIEDYARALGLKVGGHAPGEFSDMVLLSMYKSIAGSRNGSVLLSIPPVRVEEGQRLRPTLRERVATVPVLRYVYHKVQRIYGSETPSRAVETNFPEWSPQYGWPSDLCSARFFRELTEIETRGLMRRAIAEELTDSLSSVGIECVRAAHGYQPAGNFVSVNLGNSHTRDLALTKLSKKGLFVAKTWDSIPAHFRSFEDTFPFGCVNSKDLAEQMIHIRVALFSSAVQRRRLVRELQQLKQDMAPLHHDLSAASSV
jgi:dTDP-4-amino-4,6-dideoxygalactose transaminase